MFLLLLIAYIWLTLLTIFNIFFFLRMRKALLKVIGPDIDLLKKTLKKLVKNL